ncbi:MAG: GntR family transcriptional regulator [Acidimicrobiia bacterium]
MPIHIDAASDRPIYVQIADAISEQIGHGSLKPGHRLPSARSLSASLGVNMHTVLKAYARLRERAMVDMRRGRAGVVVSEKIHPKEVARRLVTLARRQGMSRSEVEKLIEELWG